MNDIRKKILIVDEIEENRSVLKTVLGDEYEIIETDSAGKALDILAELFKDIDMVLLDVEMQGIDGFDFLTIMNNKRWIEIVPVMLISDNNSPYNIRRAYGLGASDYISRPFDSVVVRRRIDNTITLNSKQKKVTEMLVREIYQGEKNANLLANILSHIVEFRNGQSSDHVLNVGLITKILLESMNVNYDKYNFSNEEINRISNAAMLHDIGKITIPDSIAYKNGKLTDEEFEIMKSHSIAGACILEELTQFQKEPLIEVAKEVCRWHHERYDGKGYPDGLKGNEIPISAQVVSVAEVYDVLTSERVYKDAITSEKAIEAIENGDCGEFNKDIVDSLKREATNIITELKLNPLSRNLNRDLRRTMIDNFGEDDIYFLDMLLKSYE